MSKKVLKSDSIKSSYVAYDGQDIGNFFTAIRVGDVDTVRFYLSAGMDPNVLNLAGNTAATELVYHWNGRSPEMLRILAFFGADY
ncbi:MAG: hypothetical protein AB8B68_05555, partial [Rickettsiaceae bacterium]